MTTLTATRPPCDVPHIDSIRPEELRGRAAGVMVGAVFGLVWVASTLSRLGSVAAVLVVLAAGVAISGVLMTSAVRLRRSASAMPPSPRSSCLGNVRRRFGLVVASEWVVIVAAANILAISNHSRWIPAVVCVAVGLHFVPLAGLFHVRLYYATAMALCLVGATTMILGASGAPASLWQLLPGFGAAVVLWATGAELLATNATPDA